MEENKVIIREFIGRYLKSQEWNDDADIFSKGFVNSLFAMQLVMFLEDKFSIKVENSELDLNNFKSVNSIVLYLENKQL